MKDVRYAAIILLALGHAAAFGGPPAPRVEPRLDDQEQQIVSEALEAEQACQSDIDRLLALRSQAEQEKDQKRVEEINELGRRLESSRKAGLDDATRRLGASGRRHLTERLAERQGPAAAAVAEPRAGSSAPRRAVPSAAARPSSTRAEGPNPEEARAELESLRESIEKRCGAAPPAVADEAVSNKGNSISVQLPRGSAASKGRGPKISGVGGKSGAKAASCGKSCSRGR